jgi:pilus assembly protein CpaE
MSISSQIPESISAEPLTIAVISPDDYRRDAAIVALEHFPNARIQEFISYPTDIDEVTRVLKLSFDVVVIDLDSDPEYTLNLVQHLCADGATNVIVYSDNVDPELMLRCLRAGSREFLKLPITPNAMAEALVRAWTRRQEATPQEIPEPVVEQKANGKLLVFLSAKGGSGVTTLASSFAVSLAEESHQRTLLIDLNLPLGDAALNLGIKSQYSTVSAFQNAERLDSHFLSSLLVSHPSGLAVLAAPSEMTSIQPSDKAIAILINVARQGFDYVVVDAGSHSDLQRAYPLDKSATLYLVTQVGVPELRNANRLIKQLPAGGSPDETGPQLEIVVNRFNAGNQDLDEAHVANALTQPVRWKIPNDYAAVRRMQNAGTSLTAEDSQIGRAILQMTRAASGQPAPEPKKKKGFRFF